MTPTRATYILATLQIDRRKLAKLTGYTERAVRNWFTTGRFPQVVGLCLEGWAQLHACGQPWSGNTTCKFAAGGSRCVRWCGDEACRGTQ